ncbi:MAG: hypothetical protein ACJ8H8_13370 [Geminicoccaceae bacterium]
MRHLGLFLASAVALGLAPYALAAQTTPTLPAVKTAPVPGGPPAATMVPKTDDDGQPSPTVPGATQSGERNDWTFEEVMGGQVKVGPQVSPAALGAGAVAGVVAFNMLAQYVFPGSNLLAQSVVAETDVAASRIYAISSAVAGALAGQYIYDQTAVDKAP